MYAYLDNVVLKLNYFYFNYEQQILKIKPKGLLYSIGLNTVFFNLFAYVANQYNIPIFCFQHCGDRRYSQNPLVKYFEDNNYGYKNIYRINIEEYGSMKLNNFYRTKISSGPKKKDVLYICSSPIETAKEYLINIPLNIQKENHIEIIRQCLKNNLSIDIKLNPVMEEEQYFYFKKLIGNNAKIKIIRGIKVENIINDYKIIITDFIQSATTDPVLLSNAKIIFYLKDKTIITGHNLFNRIGFCNIISNQKELEEELKLTYPTDYKRNVRRIINGRYYAMNVSPGLRIKNYIKSIIK